MSGLGRLNAALGRLAPDAAVVIRLAVGGVFLHHGITKIQGGVAGVAGFLNGLGIPFATLSAVVLMTVESFGAACVVLGFLTRFWAACLAIDMAVALSVAVLPGGRSPELEIMLFAGALSLVFLGDGPLSVGRSFGKAA